MDPLTLIVAALAAGGAVGVSDATSSAVTDAYAGLKARVGKRLAGRPGADEVLARHEQDPGAWRGRLMAELAECGAGGDAGLVAAARAVLGLALGAGDGKYVVDARGSQGVQAGDHNRQDNVFRRPPSA